MSKNISRLAGRKGLADNLFERITNAAETKGTLAPEDTQHIAKDYLIGDSSVVASSSFYDFTRAEHAGKEVYVCNGSACLCAGGQDTVYHALHQHFPADAIGHMTCLGRCHETKAFQYQGRNYSGNACDHLSDIIAGQVEAHSPDRYHVSAHGEAILTAPFPGLDTYYEPLQAALTNPQAALAEIKTSNLRGRGGAGFPMGLKWDSCAQVPSDAKYIICNADEGDPGAYSDRYLLEELPHSVLFGMIVAGAITGAQDGVLYIRAEYPEAIGIVERAIADLEAHNLAGEDILSTGVTFRLKVVKGAGAYICGEETALIASLEGRRPEVNIRPPYPTVEGLYGKPTVVNNVESFASVQTILARGGAAFAQIGTEKSSGTKLLCLDSFFNKPGLVEVPMGTPLSYVLDELGGGFKVPVKAVHIGGPLGGLIALENTAQLTVDFESFNQHGYLLGHGSILSIPNSMPLVEYIAHLFAFTSFESCGKCFPCRLGARRGQEMFERAAKGESKLQADLVYDLLETMQLGSLCALGGGVPLPVKNALQQFEEELTPYFAQLRAVN